LTPDPFVAGQKPPKFVLHSKP